MKSIVMNEDQNDITTPAVENAQQSDTTLHNVAHQLTAVQSQIKTATDQRPPRYGDAPVTLVVCLLVILLRQVTSTTTALCSMANM